MMCTNTASTSLECKDDVVERQVAGRAARSWLVGILMIPVADLICLVLKG